MKVKFFYGLMLVVGFLISSASFASPFTSDTGYTEPVYDALAFTADTADPVVTAKAGDFELTNYRYDSWAIYAHFKTVTDDRIPRTVLACGFESEPIEALERIPIAF